MSDGRWHNVTVRRVGNEATLEVTSDGDVLVGRVSGSKGTHRLLDTSGVLYVGANLYVVNGEIRVIDNFEGELNSVFFFLLFLDKNYSHAMSCFVISIWTPDLFEIKTHSSLPCGND